MCGLLPYHTILHESDARRRLLRASGGRRQSASNCPRFWRLPGYDGGASLHALKFEDNVNHWFCFFCCPTVVDLASRLDAYSLLEVHATGSTVRLVSSVTEMSNRPTSSREDGHYENIVQVDNAQDGLGHEITIPFVHHTIEVDLSVRPPGSRPHSASTRYDHVTQTFDVMASQEYLTTTCASSNETAKLRVHSLSASLPNVFYQCLYMSAHVDTIKLGSLIVCGLPPYHTTLCQIDKDTSAACALLWLTINEWLLMILDVIACYLLRWLSLLRLAP